MLKLLKSLFAIFLATTLVLSVFPMQTYAANPLNQTGTINLSGKMEQTVIDYYGQPGWYSERYDKWTYYGKIWTESTVNIQIVSVIDNGTTWTLNYMSSGGVNNQGKHGSYGTELTLNGSSINLTVNGVTINPSAQSTNYYNYPVAAHYNNYPTNTVKSIIVPKGSYGLKLEFKLVTSCYFNNPYDSTYASTGLNTTIRFNLNKLPQYQVNTRNTLENDNTVYLSDQSGMDKLHFVGKVWDDESHNITVTLKAYYWDGTAQQEIIKTQLINSPPSLLPAESNFEISININQDKFPNGKFLEEGRNYNYILSINDGHDTVNIFTSENVRIDKSAPTVSISSTKVKGGSVAMVNTNEKGYIYLVPYGSYNMTELDATVNNATGTKVTVNTAGNVTMTAPILDGYYRAFAVDRAKNISPISVQTLVVDSKAPSLISAVVRGDTISLTYDEVLDSSSVPANDDYFIMPSAAIGGGMHTIVAGEESLNMKLLNMDYENDPVYSETYVYTHDPSYYENSNGKASFDGQTLTSPVATFNNVGLYTLKYLFYDNPRDAAGFDEYRLPSNQIELQFLVHRRPTADFTAHSRYISATGKCDITIIDEAKDLDHESQANKGIVAYNWKWKLSTATTWTSGKPASLTPGFTYDIYLEVKDIEGAWSAPVVKSISPSTADLNTPPTVTISYSPSFVYEGDNVNISIRPVDLDGGTVNLSLERRVNGGAWSQVTTYSNVLSGSTVTYTITNIARGSYEYRVTATDPYNTTGTASTNFTVNDLTITGYVNHTDTWNQNRIKYNQSKTNTNNSPRGYEVFFPGEKFVLNATTSVISPLSSVKATNVTVRISGSSYNTTLANPSSVNWTGTLWGEDMIYWNSGPLSFVFTVTYSNGHVETDTVNVEIVRDDYWRVHHNF